MGDNEDRQSPSLDEKDDQEQTAQEHHTHLFREGESISSPAQITHFEDETDGRYTPAGCSGTMCIFTAGVILDELSTTIATSDRRTGCGFVFRPGRQHHINQRAVSFKLERKGPHLQRQDPSRFRANLRAALAAVAFRPWHDEGWNTLVIATSSSYVTEGIQRLTGREPGQWRREQLDLMSHSDLWYDLLLQIDRVRADGDMHVAFWWIPESWNEEAIECADWAARYLDPVEEWSDVVAQGVARRPSLLARSQLVTEE